MLYFLDLLYCPATRCRDTFLASSMDSSHNLEKDCFDNTTSLTLRISLCFCSHGSWLHRCRKSPSSNGALSLRLYCLLPGTLLSYMPYTKTSTLKTLQNLQEMHIKIRSSLHFHQQLCWLQKSTLLSAPTALHRRSHKLGFVCWIDNTVLPDSERDPYMEHFGT